MLLMFTNKKQLLLNFAKITQMFLLRYSSVVYKKTIWESCFYLSSLEYSPTQSARF